MFKSVENMIFCCLARLVWLPGGWHYIHQSILMAVTSLSSVTTSLTKLDPLARMRTFCSSKPRSLLGTIRFVSLCYCYSERIILFFVYFHFSFAPLIYVFMSTDTKDLYCCKLWCSYWTCRRNQASFQGCMGRSIRARQGMVLQLIVLTDESAFLSELL